MMDVEKYIKAHMFGNPTINPDDKHEFLGNFRDRVALALTVGQVQNGLPVALVQKTIQALPTGHLYINGRLGPTMQKQLLRMALAADYPFTLVTQSGVRVHSETAQPQDMAVVIAETKGPLKKRITLN
jgi:uncharacterized protein YueI